MRELFDTIIYFVAVGFAAISWYAIFQENWVGWSITISGALVLGIWHTERTRTKD